MRSAARILGIGIAVSAILDISASFLSWRGAPMDSTWEPSFWKYENMRLMYWIVFVVFVALISLAASYFAQRRLRWSAIKTAIIVFSIASVGVEYVTSVYFWRGLPDDEAVLLWFLREIYIQEHLFSWLLSLAVILPLFAYWVRRRARRRAASIASVQHYC